MSVRRSLPLLLSSVVASGLLLAAAGGCSSGEPCPDPGSPDGGVAIDMAPPAPRCELPFDVRAIDTVSTGAVTITDDPLTSGVYLAEIDATAGGGSNYGKNPFVYLDLIGRKKVEIDDVTSRKSRDWDIAFKRWQIKLNSGDSGPGTVTIQRVENRTLPDVKMAPGGTYAEDLYFDEKCDVQLDPIGGLATVVSDWYGYEAGTNRLVPKTEVWVLKRRDGKGHIKLQLLQYYKGMAGGNFQLTWSYLP